MKNTLSYNKLAENKFQKIDFRKIEQRKNIVVKRAGAGQYE